MERQLTEITATTKIEELSKDEKSLLMYFEARSVDYSGTVDARNMNSDDFELAKYWKEMEFIDFGRIYSGHLNQGRSHWVELSNKAVSLAQDARRLKAIRRWANRTWLKSTEK